MKTSKFKEILKNAVPANYNKEMVTLSQSEWKTKSSTSDVLIHLSDDCDPTGTKLKRQVVEFQFKSQFLEQKDLFEYVEDITVFVKSQRPFSSDFHLLKFPTQRVFEFKQEHNDTIKIDSI